MDFVLLTFLPEADSMHGCYQKLGLFLNMIFKQGHTKRKKKYSRCDDYESQRDFLFLRLDVSSLGVPLLSWCACCCLDESLPWDCWWLELSRDWERLCESLSRGSWRESTGGGGAGMVKGSTGVGGGANGAGGTNGKCRGGEGGRRGGECGNPSFHEVSVAAVNCDLY